MRLRVEVLRQGLPPAKVLWTVAPESTASQLLEQIDDVFPLEAADWGFEDYSLQSNGYEVLHWMQLGQLLKDDDPVTIKPLQTNDIRARRLSGRHQVTSDGRHLVDGVAFGRPLLRRPVRPDIHIPPRKRVRLTEHEDEEDEDDDDEEEEDKEDNEEQGEDDDDDVEAELNEQLRMLGHLLAQPKSPDQDKYNDQDNEKQLLLEGPPHGQDNFTQEEFKNAILGLARRQAAKTGKKRRKGKRVSFDRTSAPSYHKGKDHEHEDDDEGEDEEDDEDYHPLSEVDEDADTSEDEDVVMSESGAKGSDSSSSSWNGVASGAATPDITRKPRLNADDISSSDDSSDASRESDEDSDSEDSSSDESSSAPSEQGIKEDSKSNVEDTKQPSAPFEGKTATRKRNERRRHNKKLNYLKSQGILPQHATRDHLREWEATNEKAGATDGQSEQSVEEQQGAIDLSNKSQQSINVHESPSESSSASDSDSDSDSENSSSDEEHIPPPNLKAQGKKQPTHANKTTELTSAFEAKRAALLAALAAGGVDVQTPLESEDRPMSLSSIVNMANTSSDPSVEASPAEATRRRVRLDVSASERLLFGSLGVRRPKNESDKAKLRQTLATQGKHKPASQPNDTPQFADQEGGDEFSQDPKLWKKKINLTAVECVDEDVEYTRPPFPFRQRWDPQMREKKRKRGSQAFSASKKGKYDTEYHESYDVEGGDALEYDDEGDYGVQSYYEDVDSKGYDKDDNYYEDGEAGEGAAAEAEAQLLRETTNVDPSSTTEPIVEDDDLPALPHDFLSLPSLTPESALTNAIITFTRLEVSAATGWVPATAPVRVAKIQEIYDDDAGKVLELKLANRDVPKKHYDGQGRRVFSGFDMELEEDDGEEGEERRGVLEIALSELLEGRILQPAPAKTKNANADQIERIVIGDVGVEGAVLSPGVVHDEA